MKRIVSLSLILLILFLLPVVATAVNSPVDLYINGIILDSDVPKKVINHHTYLPLSVISEQLEIDVRWNVQEQAATIIQDNKHIVLHIDQTSATVDGRSMVMSVAPFIEDETVFLPLNFLGEQLGFRVIWDPLTQSIILFKKHKSMINSEELTNNPTGFNTKLPPVSMMNEENLAVVQSVNTSNGQLVIQLSSVGGAQSFYLSNPYRFVVDIPYSTLGTTINGQAVQQNGEIASNMNEIKKIRYAMHDETSVRMVFELSEHVAVRLSENKQTNQLIGVFEQQAYRVVIDAGHGGKDPGADGASGRYEKEFNLSVSKKIEALLKNEPQIQVFMTRTDDSTISLDDRALFANNLNADIFISIHGNTFTAPISGVETYYWKPPSLRLASIMHEHVLEGTKLPDRKVRKIEYRVLRDTTMPATLLELGYLSTPNEEKLMLTEEFQNRVAASIVEGIKQYFEIK